MGRDDGYIAACKASSLYLQMETPGWHWTNESKSSYFLDGLISKIPFDGIRSTAASPLYLKYELTANSYCCTHYAFQ